ncbi:hypothetical protein EDB92DRAFT_1844660 [Lactarius akahatsu]|uniref:Uncharacterized protein n=1 Tax=Lactarius akahatsu TaxID=416441 RepID=A0AAD4LMB8_9AGAM|nr:hypothetical protein EDB92DRAFT_1844660 [Lactarius akahatsu]
MIGKHKFVVDPRQSKRSTTVTYIHRRTDLISPVNDGALCRFAYSLKDRRLACVRPSYNEHSKLDFWKSTTRLLGVHWNDGTHRFGFPVHKGHGDAMVAIYITTFQTDNLVISELVWLKLDRNLSNRYFEKCSLDGQGSTSHSTGAVLEFVRLACGAGIVLEHELEIGCRTCLDKIDRYFYATILVILRTKGSLIVHISYRS